MHRSGRFCRLAVAGRRGQGQALLTAELSDHDHQPSGGAQGQATDIEIQARENPGPAGEAHEIYVKHTNQPLEAIQSALERDKFLSPIEAMEFGLIDEVSRAGPAARNRKEASNRSRRALDDDKIITVRP